jgi:3-polyprenyl-4-hydroxybenzoate decarboxylase
MLAATEAGAIIYPPVPAFYAGPKSLEDYRKVPRVSGMMAAPIR